MVTKVVIELNDLNRFLLVRLCAAQTRQQWKEQNLKSLYLTAFSKNFFFFFLELALNYEDYNSQI